MDWVTAASFFASEDAHIAAKVREAERNAERFRRGIVVDEVEALRQASARGRKNSGATQTRKAAERRAARDS